MAISACLLTLGLAVADAQTTDTPPELPAVKGPPPPDPEVGSIDVAEYRVRGAKLLNSTEVGAAVYPYLGPSRTEQHIEGARAALEKAYHDKGYQTVTVSVPPQSARKGIVFLQVEEVKVGKLRVKNARNFLLSDIRRRAKSLAPGTVPNFNDVQKDIIKLNSSADLRVTPALTPGEEPGTVDIDLNVEDAFPIHGSLELNNRYSENTVPLRLNGSLNYSNLWQLGHTLGFSFQIAPERLDDATVYSAFYSIPFTENWGMTFSGTKQDSNVSTLGGAAVAGRGEILGMRANFTLPAETGFYHSLSVGLDYKHFDEDVAFGGTVTQTPIDYYPFSIGYYFSAQGKKGFTEGNLSANWHYRGTGSEVIKFDDKRYNADGAYIYFRGDVSHTHDLPLGFQVMGKVQGQFSNYPLINSEQYAGGGLSSVRGYLESAALGDSGVFGTLELRSPSFIGTKKTKAGEKNETATSEPSAHEWRIFGFIDGGQLDINQPLPDQQEKTSLASIGIGSSVKLWEHFNSSVDVALPLKALGTTEQDEWFVSFRVWSEF